MIRLYRDGFTFGPWLLRVRRAWIRGLTLGVEWRPGPWRESPATHSTLVVRLGVVALSFEHAGTRVGPAEESLP